MADPYHSPHPSTNGSQPAAGGQPDPLHSAIEAAFAQNQPAAPPLHSQQASALGLKIDSARARGFTGALRSEPASPLRANPAASASSRPSSKNCSKARLRGSAASCSTCRSSSSSASPFSPRKKRNSQPPKCRPSMAITASSAINCSTTPSISPLPRPISRPKSRSIPPRELPPVNDPFAAPKFGSNDLPSQFSPFALPDPGKGFKNGDNDMPIGLCSPAVKKA